MRFGLSGITPRMSRDSGDDPEATPIFRPHRMFTELTELRRRVARAELMVSISLAVSIGLFCGLLAYVARALAG